MNQIYLKNVTLVAVSSIKIEETIFALIESAKKIDYFEIIFISHEKPNNLPIGIKFKKCDRLKSIEEYNYFMLFQLSDYIDSEFGLVVQYDGYVLHPNKWDDNFLYYDYIGAPWQKDYYFLNNGENIRVGNGGFSLRSKKLLNIFNDLEIAFKDKNISNYNEDSVICLYCRRILEAHGIKFAPVSIASMFSTEELFSDSSKESFGFHLSKIKFIDKLKRIIRNILNFLNIKIFFYSDDVVLFKNKK